MISYYFFIPLGARCHGSPNPDLPSRGREVKHSLYEVISRIHGCARTREEVLLAMPRPTRGPSPTPSHRTCGAVTIDYSATGTLHYDKVEDSEKASEHGTHHDGSTASEDGRATISYSRAAQRQELESISRAASDAVSEIDGSVARSRSPSVKSIRSMPIASGRSRHSSESPRRSKPTSKHRDAAGSSRPRWQRL